jgi:hypothetical protein
VKSPAQPRRPAADREKQQRYRRRQAGGLIVLKVEVEELRLCEALERAGRLCDTMDRGAVSREVSQLIREWCDCWR